MSERIDTLAEAIYTEVFGTIDDARFESEKTTEILDWLADGDEGKGRTVADLADEWREYDAADVAARFGA